MIKSKQFHVPCKDPALAEFWQILDDAWGEQEDGANAAAAAGGAPPSPPGAGPDPPAADAPAADSDPEHAADAADAADASADPPAPSQDSADPVSPAEEPTLLLASRLANGVSQEALGDSQPVGQLDMDSQMMDVDDQFSQMLLGGSQDQEPIEESQQLEDAMNPYAVGDDVGEEQVTFEGIPKQDEQAEVPLPSPKVDKSPAFSFERPLALSAQSLSDVEQQRQNTAAKLEALKWGVKKQKQNGNNSSFMDSLFLFFFIF